MIICDICKVVCKKDEANYVEQDIAWALLPKMREVCDLCDEKLMDMKDEVFIDFGKLMNTELARRILEYGKKKERHRNSLKRRRSAILKKAKGAGGGQ